MLSPELLERTTDLKLSEDGDIVLDQYGGIELVRGEDAIIQQIRWRLVTELGDWKLAPDCGTLLWTLAGAPNSEETGERIRGEVARALTYDGFIPAELMRVEVAPSSETEIAVFVVVEGLSRIVQFTYDLQRGDISGWQYVTVTA